MFRKLVPTSLLVALLIFALAGTASAHSTLVSSTPADGATLKAAPAQIVLVFSAGLCHLRARCG